MVLPSDWNAGLSSVTALLPGSSWIPSALSTSRQQSLLLPALQGHNPFLSVVRALSSYIHSRSAGLCAEPSDIGVGSWRAGHATQEGGTLQHLPQPGQCSASRCSTTQGQRTEGALFNLHSYFKQKGRPFACRSLPVGRAYPGWPSGNELRDDDSWLWSHELSADLSTKAFQECALFSPVGWF